MPQVGLNTVYELITTAVAGATVIKNVYHYQSLAASPGVLDWLELAQLFETDVLPEVADVVTSNQTFVNIAVRRLDSIVDFGEWGIAVAGTKAGTQAPSYCTGVIKLIRATKETGNGRKSLGRLVKDDFSGDIMTAAALVILDLAADAIKAVITGPTHDYNPVIVGGKIDSGGNPVPEADWLFTDIQNAICKPNVSTQNSRKIGVGE